VFAFRREVHEVLKNVVASYKAQKLFATPALSFTSITGANRFSDQLSEVQWRVTSFRRRSRSPESLEQTDSQTRFQWREELESLVTASVFKFASRREVHEVTVLKLEKLERCLPHDH